jgi:hypothetical protein
MKIGPGTETEFDDEIKEKESPKSTEIPARARTRKIFYLRRDMHQILTSRNEREWIDYADANVRILDFSCVSSVFYKHPELRKFVNSFQSSVSED